MGRLRNIEWTSGVLGHAMLVSKEGLSKGDRKRCLRDNEDSKEARRTTRTML